MDRPCIPDRVRVFDTAPHCRGESRVRYARACGVAYDRVSSRGEMTLHRVSPSPQPWQCHGSGDSDERDSNRVRRLGAGDLGSWHFQAEGVAMPTDAGPVLMTPDEWDRVIADIVDRSAAQPTIPPRRDRHCEPARVPDLHQTPPPGEHVIAIAAGVPGGVPDAE